MYILGITTLQRTTNPIETMVTSFPSADVLIQRSSDKGSSNVTNTLMTPEGITTKTMRNDSKSLLETHTSSAKSREKHLDNHMLTVITAVSASIATVLIIAIIIIVTRNRTRKTRKRRIGDNIETEERSAVSKVYAEIDDNMVLTSCSLENLGTSASREKAGGYETLVDVHKKGGKSEGSSRGSYAHLDEATKRNTCRGSHQHLDDRVSSGGDDSLREASVGAAFDCLKGENSNVTKPKLTTLTENTLEENVDNQAKEVLKKNIKEYQTTEHKTMRKVTKPNDKPPHVHDQRDGAKQIPVPRYDHGEENKEIPVVLSTTSAHGRQLTRDSYDVPPVQTLKHDVAIDYDVPPTQKAKTD